MFGALYIETPGDQSAGQWETGTGAVMAPEAGGGGGSPHVPLAALVFGVIALRAITDSPLVPESPSLIRVSLLNGAIIYGLYKLFDYGFKWATLEMAKRGIALPGQVAFTKL